MPNNGMNTDFKMLTHFKTGYPRRSAEVNINNKLNRK